MTEQYKHEEQFQPITEELPVSRIPMSSRSRLSRNLERQSKKNLIFSIIGILIVLFVLVKFGVPLLVNFSLLLGGSSTKEDTDKKNNSVFVSAPVLDPLPTATNSATTKLSGKSQPKHIILIYINDELVNKTEADDKGEFVIDNIKLIKGSNSIKAKATPDENSESDFSNELTVTVADKAPDLSIDFPQDGYNFGKDDTIANITGKTNPGVRVTINGFWAIVDDSGAYSYSLPLQGGENTIKVLATDQAGNKTEKEIKVTYSP